MARSPWTNLMHHSPLMLSLLISILAWPPAALAIEDDALLKRVKAEYPAALNRLESSFRTVRGSGKSRVVIPLPKSAERTIVAEFSFAFRGDSRRVVRRFTDTSPERTGSRGEAYCINPTYSFSLSRDEPDKPYLLNGFATSGKDSVVATLRALAGDYVDAPFMVDGFAISRLMAAPGFRFSRASPASEGGLELIKLEFDCPNPDRGSNPEPWIYAGSLIVAPAKAWRLQYAEYFVHQSLKRMFKVTIDYGESNGDVPLPKKVAVVEPSHLTRTWEFDELSLAPTPEAEFTMAAFGLPDLMSQPGVDQSRSHLGYWFVGLAIAGIIAAFTMRRLASRA